MDINVLIFDSKDPKAYEGFNSLTLSGVLNALDGVDSSDGRIVFMTTNYIDRLDPAMIRPGRVDFKQFIGYASEYQASAMYRRFYPHDSDQMALQFARQLAALNKPISSAQIQGFFMFFKNDSKQAINNINSYFNK